jgi:hypothetical protein
MYIFCSFPEIIYSNSHHLSLIHLNDYILKS